MRKKLTEEPRTIELISIRFPDKRAEIERNLENNLDLQELCEDYLEVTTLLDNCRRQTKNPVALIEVCYALLKYLESKIDENLRNQQK
jgi:hypothetical protein